MVNRIVILISIAIVCFVAFFIIGVLFKSKQEQGVQQFYVCADERDARECYAEFKGLRIFNIN